MTKDLEFVLSVLALLFLLVGACVIIASALMVPDTGLRVTGLLLGGGIVLAVRWACASWRAGR